MVNSWGRRGCGHRSGEETLRVKIVFCGEGGVCNDGEKER